MALVFVRLHPELENDFAIERTWERYSKFRSSRLAELATQRAGTIDFDAIISTCEAYETQLPLASDREQKYIKLALSSLYLRLFRASFELGVLTKLDPSRADYEHYL